MPIHNEVIHIREVVNRVIAVKLQPEIEKEVILVDDGSTDGTSEILESFQKHPEIKLHKIKSNRGKGNAVRMGIIYATGDIILIQDGDLEYDPNDYPALIQPIVDGNADVVFGSRFRKGIPAGMSFSNYIANKLLAGLANILYKANITDEATAYKVFRASVIKKISLKCERFEFCPEIVAKIRKRKYNIFEVSINYQGRSIKEGKKIKWKDGILAVWTLIKYRF